MKYKITYIGGSHNFLYTHGIVNVDNLNGHIVSYIQNLILCAYHVDNFLYFYHDCGFPANIAQRLFELLSPDNLADNSTKSWIWCPLIWNALNLDNTPETFKNHGNQLTPEQQTYINYYAEKLSEFPGWRDYALNILTRQFSIAAANEFDDPNINAWSSDYGNWVPAAEAATIITNSQINEIKGLINNPFFEDPYNIKLNYLKQAYGSKDLNYKLSEVENNAFLNILKEKLSEEEYKEFLNILGKNKILEQFLQQKIDIDIIPENIKKEIGIGIFTGEFDELLSTPRRSNASIYSIFINATDISKYIIENIDIVIDKISNNKISDQNFLELKTKMENRESELELSDDEFIFLNQNFLKIDDKQITSSSSSSSSSSSRSNMSDPYFILEQFLQQKIDIDIIPENIKKQIGIGIFIGEFDELLSNNNSNALIYSIFINPTDISKYIIENHAQININKIYEENLNELKFKLENNDLELNPAEISNLNFIINPNNQEYYENNEEYNDEEYDDDDV